MITVLACSALFAGSAPAITQGPPNIPELADSAGRFQTLLAAVGAAGLADTLASEGPFTVFAPSDQAFSLVDESTIKYLLTDEGRPDLTRILTHHVVAGRLDAGTLVGQDEVETLAGTVLPLEVARNRLLVGDAVVEQADLAASNGIVHVIDRVLLPPKQVSPREALITAAVERGVPLFNDGNPDACAAVYATALEAIALGEGFGLDANGRKALTARIERAAKMSDVRARAWEYRRLIDQLWADDTMQSTDPSRTASAPARIRDSGTLLYDFSNQSQASQWRTVLDGVMGGRSTGRISMENGNLLFQGATSLENNGGFSSMRAPVAKGAFDGDANAIRIRVKGDGRTWILGTRGSRNMGGDAYWYRFDTKDGEWTEVTVPIAEMERHYFGRKLPGRLTPDNVRGIDFYIYDKNAGPFRLEVDTIEAIRVPQESLAFDA